MRRFLLSAAAFPVLVVLAGVVVLGLRKHWHQWPWQSWPDRLHACGRDYAYPDGPVSPSEMDVGAHQLARVWDWRGHQQVWGMPGIPGDDDCGTVVWLKTGHHSFTEYALLGGP